MNLVKIDDNHIYQESKTVDKFSTWGEGWKESIDPDLKEGKFYKLIKKDEWLELDKYPKDMSRPNDYSVFDDTAGEWVDDTDLLSKAITEKATEIIESIYSPLKQRKLMSMSIALQDKLIEGQTLTAEEQTLRQSCKDVNTWVTAIRTIENTAITNGTTLTAINWTV